MVPSAFASGAGRRPGGGAWRAAAVLAWAAGLAWQLSWARLPGPAGRAAGAMGVLGLAGVALGAWALSGWLGRHRAACRALAAAASLAFCAGSPVVLATAMAQTRLASRLPSALEGRDLLLEGCLAEMPQWREDGARIVLDVRAVQVLPVRGAWAPGQELDLGRVAPQPDVGGPDTVAAAPLRTEPQPQWQPQPPASPSGPWHPGLDFPARVSLSWSRQLRDERAVTTGAAALEAGQCWRVPVRLRQPHGAMNPAGFDAELWLFEQGLGATGTVRGPGVRTGAQPALIERARQAVRDRLLLSALPAGGAGVLAALTVGDQAAIDGPGWDRFRQTGVAHLMSISGLHITMLAALGARVLGLAWACWPAGLQALPAPLARRWAAVGVAWLYALLAGWGVPAQRTVLMLAGTALLQSLGPRWPPALVALAALVPVTALDPWALLQPGFWLSFAAVLLLLLSDPARVGPDLPGPRPASVSRTEAADGDPPPRWRRALTRLRHELGAGARAQVVASLGLLPLSLVAFQQVSVVGLLANLVAVPWVTLVVTPLALAGVVWAPLWTLAVVALAPLQAWLALLAAWPWASVAAPEAPAWAVSAGLAGSLLMMLPLHWRARLAGALMVLPLAAPAPDRPPPGQFELLALDVGQGTAVLVRTAGHLLLFDTGPAWGPDSDAGQRLVLPALQARGERQIDLLVLSHRDSDHVGGAASLIARLPVRRLLSSLAPDHPLQARVADHARCEAGQSWVWDGVRLRVLHPLPADFDRPAPRPNALSCVLLIEDAQGRRALLTGDIEAEQEQALLARAAPLRSDILLVPHHGSRTSSTAAFLAAVQPDVSVVQAGYLNRYGHPAPDVMARYRASGLTVVRTDQCGAWGWRDARAWCTRLVRGRYWHAGALPSEGGPAEAGSDVAKLGMGGGPR